jgi:hypothetical protein
MDHLLIVEIMLENKYGSIGDSPSPRGDNSEKVKIH